MKNKNLASTLEEIKKINISGKSGYCLAKNRKLIEDELEAINETIKALPDFETYEKERITLLEAHASKDEQDKPIIENNAYKIENQELWELDIKELQEKHKETIENRKKQIKDFNALMEEETTLVFHKITEDQIPDSATASEVYTLLKFI